MTGRIASLEALEGVVGRTPPAIHLKVIDHLDETALRWIAHSPLAFIALAGDARVMATLAGGETGFADAERGLLRLPLDILDEPEVFHVGLGFGSLFLIPGIGETLRVNGAVAEITGGEAVIAVSECYVHCAKALIRSDFWQAQPVADVPADPAGFAAACRFVALATSDPAGGTDLSPKGDPAGAMVNLADDGTLWFADRPGNRRVDSFRNIIAHPDLGGVMIVPGSTTVGIVRGAAHLTDDEECRARFTVEGKVPLLAVGVEQAAIHLRESAALKRAAIWPFTGTSPDIKPAKMFAAHLKLNKDKGIGAKLASAFVSIPGLMQKGLDKDYKDNLY